MFCIKCKDEFYKTYGIPCVICNGLHLSNDKVCSDSYQLIFCEIDEDHICKVCFCPIYDDKDKTKHHIDYFPENIVLVHRSCHSEIHKSWK